MKQIAKNAVVASILLIFSLSSFAQVQTLAFSQYCAAGFSQTWTLTITGPYFVRMTYSADIDVSDNISFFNPEGGYPIAYNSGYCTGSVLTTSTPGSAKVGFYAATAGYKSFIVQYYANNPLETKGDLNVLGNAAVAGTTTLNGNTTVNGLFSVPSTSVTNSIMGKLGIGTASATRKLEIWDNSASRFSFSGSNCTSGYEVASTIDDTGYKINVGSSIRNYKVSIAGTDRLTISTSGYVGIGTTSPTDYLSIAGTTTWVGQSLKSGSSSGGAYIDFYKSTGTKLGGFTLDEAGSSLTLRSYSGTNGIIKLQTNSLDRLIVNASGSVGIGTTTPGAKLEVTDGQILINSGDAVYCSKDKLGYSHQLIGTYQGWDRNTVYIAGYNNSNLSSSFVTQYVTFGGPGGGGERMRVNLMNGNVSIGTLQDDPGSLLTVNGVIHAKEVKIDLTGPLADYVFDKSYDLMPLNKVEEYVNTNSHLPEMPSAAEVKEKGLSMGEMQNKLLQKVEELTLYVIDLKKTNDAQNAEIKELKKQLSAKR